MAEGRIDHAREGVEWLRKLAETQSREDRREKFERMADAVESVIAEVLRGVSLVQGEHK